MLHPAAPALKRCAVLLLALVSVRVGGAETAAELTVIRPTAFIGSEMTYFIAIDQQPPLDLESREHVALQVAPGRHTVAVRCPKAMSLNYAETRIEHEFTSGQPVFFVVSPKFDCVALQTVAAREGSALLANTSPRPPGRPGGYREGTVTRREAVETAEMTPNDQVSAATAAWVEAFNSRDAARISALYDAEAVLTDAGEPRPRIGAAAIAEYYRNAAKRSTQRVALGERKVRLLGDTAIDSGTLTYFEMRDGRATTTPGRYSLTYQRRGGKWLVVDHQTSLTPQ